MSNIKKRVLVLVSGLALALIMGAVSNGPEYGVGPVRDSGSVSIYDLDLKVAGHSDGNGGCC